MAAGLHRVGYVTRDAHLFNPALHARLHRRDLEWVEPDLQTVSNRPLRQEFLRQQSRYGLSFSELGRRMCGEQTGVNWKGMQVARLLGLTAVTDNAFGRRTRITYQLACELARALDMDPVDAGI